MKLFLIDAYALIYRSYYAFIKNPRINSRGENTGTILGFINTLLEIIEKESPTHLGVAFDPKGGSFRNKIYEQYKAQRPETPEDIQWAVPRIKEIISAFDIPIYEVSGYEADDVIGTLSKQADKQGIRTYLMTPDKDYCQLVTENVFLYKPSYGDQKYTVLGPKEVKEKYGLDNCSQVIDLLGLMGDTADNIPGCKGVGEKTAPVLIKEFGTIENLLENTDKISGKLREKIEAGRDDIIFSKKLATIETNVDINLNLEELEVNTPNLEKLEKLLKELELFSIIKRIKTKFNQPEAKPKNSNIQPDLFEIFQADNQQAELFSNVRGSDLYEIECNYIVNQQDIDKIIEKIIAQKKFAFCISFEGFRLNPSKFTGFYISTQNNECDIIQLPDNKEQSKEIICKFKELFENPEIEKIGFDLKPMFQILWSIGIKLKGKIYDNQIAHYILQPEQNHKFENIVWSILNIELYNSKYSTEINITALCLELKEKLEQQLENENQTELLQNIEMPLIEVLAYMEKNGVIIDSSSLKETELVYKNKLGSLSEQIYRLSGEEFNISSPKQVGHILFEVLGLGDKNKKTKSGGLSTSEEVLEELSDTHPIVGLILEYRGIKKLLSTYIEALPELVNSETGKIHTFFNQTVTATGRLSSSVPNLQNIPVRNLEGREIRKAFIPESGCKFFSADYSQIELRIMAHCSGDTSMIQNFNENMDIHAWTAAKVFHKEIEDVTKEERSKAKSANFGIIYGISAFGLARDMKVSRTEAKELIDNYFLTYPRVKEYIDECVQTAQQNGYIVTMFNRKRYLTDINSRNSVVRKYAERNAVNAPIQGSAADIIKIAMINIYRKFVELNLKSTMILQVHDELNFNVVPGEEKTVEQIVIGCMEQAARMRVPLHADCGWGKNWLEAH